MADEAKDPQSLPEVKELEQQTQALAKLAEAYTVTDPQQYSAAGAELLKIKAALKRVDDIRKGMTRPLDAAKKAIMEFFRPFEERLARAENLIKRGMVGYSQEQQRLQAEKQRQADEAARKERERIEEQARRAAKAGKDERAEQLLQRASAVVPHVVNLEPPKLPGIRGTENWTFEIVDEELIPREYLTPDLKKIGAVARAMKKQANIAGVRVFSKDGLAAGSAA